MMAVGNREVGLVGMQLRIGHSIQLVEKKKKTE